LRLYACWRRGRRQDSRSRDRRYYPPETHFLPARDLGNCVSDSLVFGRRREALLLCLRKRPGLEAAKGPVEAMVVDGGERPSAN
jgi:hypothetical protein